MQKFRSFDMKRRLVLLLSMIVSGISYRCAENIPDCPNQMCVLAGSWKLTAVYYDNASVLGDFSQFRLTLIEPQPTTNETSGFTRIQASGEPDAGSWSIENNGTILRLIPNDISELTENWMIESFSPRELVLIINRDTGIKEGPATIRLLLEPIE
jgi:hypothetical protein